MQTGYLVGLGFLAIGVVIFFLGLRDYRIAKASAGWPATEGSITQICIRTDDRGENHESSHPAITSDYRVMGSPHQGSRPVIGATPSYSNHRKAEAFLEAYPIGKRVTVHYNPEKSDQSVLEAGVIRGAIGTLIISGVFALFGLIAIVLTLL